MFWLTSAANMQGSDVLFDITANTPGSDVLFDIGCLHTRQGCFVQHQPLTHQAGMFC